MSRLDWFEINGVKSTAHGIHLAKMPDIIWPEERVEFEPVYGRSGELTKKQGEDVYEDVTYPLECWIEDYADLHAVREYLRGAVNLMLPNQQLGVYHAQLVNQIALERVLRTRTWYNFVLNFRCAPFCYHSGVQDIVLTTGSIITNPGDVASAPVIAIEGEGEINLMVGSQTLLLNGLETGTPLVLDCALEETYERHSGGLPDTSANHKMDGDYPLIGTGEVAVSWSGTVTKVTISPRWRSLTGVV